MKHTIRCVAALLACQTFCGAFCDDDALDPATGNFGRLSDVVLVTPNPNDTVPHSYAIVANPELEQLRVFDTLERRFVRAPNAFFPLSIKTGPATRRLTTSQNDASRVYALDSSLNSIQLIRTVSEDNKAAFTTVGDGVETAAAPHDLVVVGSADTAIAFVSLPQEGEIQVLSIDADRGVGTEIKRIDLGADAYPAGLALDPTENAIIVADFALDSVAVIRVADQELDRRIDIGGPSENVFTGQVDPGDGLAPVALITQAAMESVAVLRLFRPNYREDPYALLGHAQIPGVPVLAHLPNQDPEAFQVAPRVCCPGVTADAEATYSWAAVMTAAGKLYYLKLDGQREENAFQRGGLVRLLDNIDAPPTASVEVNADAHVWYPVDSNDALRPSIQITAIDNFGDPPISPLWKPGLFIEMTWEGFLPNGVDRFGSFEGNALQLEDNGLSFSEIGVQTDDLVEILTEQLGASCQSERTWLYPVTSVSSASIELGTMSLADAACLSAVDSFSFDLRVPDAFSVRSSQHGFIGRLALSADSEAPLTNGSVALPGLEISGQASQDGKPTMDSQLIFGLSQNLGTVGMDLSAVSNSFLGEVDRISALVPMAMAGAEMYIEVSGDATPELARRIILVTGAGRILEFNETETNDNFVIGPTSY
jgi:hypothetical protein